MCALGEMALASVFVRRALQGCLSHLEPNQRIEEHFGASFYRMNTSSDSKSVDSSLRGGIKVTTETEVLFPESDLESDRSQPVV
jgi:hypothetical protein